MKKRTATVPQIAPLHRAVSRTVYPSEIRVLVVDDDETSRADTVARLEGDGFQVTTADGIASAFASLEQSPVHVMVLDMEMPNPGGEAGDAGLVVLRALARRDVKPRVIVFT